MAGARFVAGGAEAAMACKPHTHRPCVPFLPRQFYVFEASWLGTPVAVKRIVMPSEMPPREIQGVLKDNKLE